MSIYRAAPESEAPQLAVSAQDAAEWPALATQWAELVALCPDATFFVTREWVETWLEAFAEELRPTILTFHEADRLVGACLLVRRHARRGPFVIRRIHLNTAGEADRDSPCVEFNVLLCMPGYELAVASCLRDHLVEVEEPWDELAAPGMIEGAGRAALATLFEDLDALDDPKPSYYVDLGALRARGGDYVKTLGSRDRTRFRQNIRKYGELGELALERMATVADAQRCLEELAALHQKTWTERGFPGSFSSPTFFEFHRRLIARCFQLGHIDLLRVRAAGATVGCHYNFVYRSKSYFYQSGYDYQLGERSSPGMIVHGLAIQDATRRGLDEYDFMAGDVDYKRKMAPAHRTLHWQIWRASSLKMKTFEMLRRTKHTVQRRLRGGR